MVGICTDVCVMDFVLTMLSARNHGMMPSLERHRRLRARMRHLRPNRGTRRPAPLDLPADRLPTRSAVTHYLGLYFMAARGAVLADRLA